MKKILFLIMATIAAPAFAQDCVILLHGLLRTADSMNAIEAPLKNNGYFVVNESYPSTSDDILSLADDAIGQGLQKCPKDARINFVTHSMGGILVRAYYANKSRPRPNRVVMLAPPNQGSEVIDSEAFDWLGGIAGEAGAQLGTDENSIPNTLGPVDYPVGIIAGETTLNPIFSAMIPGNDDGAVAVDRTHVEGETDWVLIPASHSLIMFSELAQRQTLEFLQNGRFAK